MTPRFLHVQILPRMQQEMPLQSASLPRVCLACPNQTATNACQRILTLVSLLAPVVFGADWSGAAGRASGGVGVTIFNGSFGIFGTK